MFLLDSNSRWGVFVFGEVGITLLLTSQGRYATWLAIRSALRSAAVFLPLVVTISQR